MVSEGRKGAAVEEPKAEDAPQAAAPGRAPMFSAAGLLVLFIIVLIEGVGIYAILKYTSTAQQGEGGPGGGPGGWSEDDIFLEIDEVTAPLHGAPLNAEKNLRVKVAVAVDKKNKEKVETLIKEKKPALIQIIRRAMTDVVNYNDVIGPSVGEAEDRLQRRIAEEFDRPMGHHVKQVVISDMSYF
ncbi:MAG: hypothetical protein HYY93_16210 [Planctomycetes bacterium]|nr:hypothetical protein [Planctomycetota bacterium]